MDQSLKLRIENEYPYPIALEFRRLNTMEYIEPNDKRLKQLLKTSESTIHFLSLIALINLCENYERVKQFIGEAFIRDFPSRFTHTSYGKWIALMRDITKIFQVAGIKMFISEMVELFIRGKSESDAQKAFNNLNNMRNKLAHPDTNLTRADIKDYCTEAEQYFDIILTNLLFITNYPFLHVDKITVDYHKYQEPAYYHTFAKVSGTSSEFNAYKKTQSKLTHTPAFIVTKQNETNYLNLEPLIILSDEGKNKINDIFMYMDWEPGKSIKYRPVYNGGEFNLIGSQKEADCVPSLNKFWEYLSDNETYQKYMKRPVEKIFPNDDNEIIKFSFDD